MKTGSEAGVSFSLLCQVSTTNGLEDGCRIGDVAHEYVKSGRETAQSTKLVQQLCA